MCHAHCYSRVMTQNAPGGPAASQHVKEALNLLDERLLEAPEALGRARLQLAPVVEQIGRLMAVLVE
jgi:hypothetical protein